MYLKHVPCDHALFSLSLASVSKLTDRYGLILGLGIVSGAQPHVAVSFETLSLYSVHLQALMWYADPRSVGNNFAEISVAVDEVVMLLQQLLHL
jgi:hypothetical protein